MSHEQFAALYETGLAYGHCDIKTDTMHFSFKDEKFEFPALIAHGLATFNGYFYTAPIEKLRALANKN